VEIGGSWWQVQHLSFFGYRGLLDVQHWFIFTIKLLKLVKKGGEIFEAVSSQSATGYLQLWTKRQISSDDGVHYTSKGGGGGKSTVVFWTLYYLQPTKNPNGHMLTKTKIRVNPTTRLADKAQLNRRTIARSPHVPSSLAISAKPATIPTLEQCIRQVQQKADNLNAFIAKSNQMDKASFNWLASARITSFFASSNMRAASSKSIRSQRRELNRTLRRLLSTEAKPNPADQTPPPPANPFEQPNQQEGAKPDDGTPPPDPELAKKLEVRRVGWLRTLFSLLLAFATALCLFELYCIINGNDDWLAYLSFIPIANVRTA